MKVIGLIGGISWESSLEYYRIINKAVKERLGGFHSAKCILYSLDFDEVVRLQHEGKWHELARLMTNAAVKLERAGAELLLICANTMHKVADHVQERVRIPLIHIIDVTAERILERGIKRVGLLGTRFTMEDGFYRKRMGERFNIEVLLPDKDERELVHRIIYEELCQGVIRQSSKESIRKIIERLKLKGAEGIILGCTELPLLIKQGDVDIPVFDTTKIHAIAAVEHALK
ncbi:MAG: aspartate racemase [Thermoprotei archaeon]|nr:MAG: aspartate racemase [Thermoprotei archaeon]HDI32011.1 aspartate/glutamate racemase family protein [Thermofilum sp.]